jgi:hypothetical protein
VQLELCPIADDLVFVRRIELEGLIVLQPLDLEATFSSMSLGISCTLKR